jgi:hypothetical protein
MRAGYAQLHVFSKSHLLCAQNIRCLTGICIAFEQDGADRFAGTQP